MESRGLHKTDIEKEMKNELTKQGIEFVEEYPIRCKFGYIADFFIPSKNLIVECDGEPFHKRGNSRDRKRDAVLKKMGFNIIRFRGKEIRNDVQQCVDRIKCEEGSCEKL